VTGADAAGAPQVVDVHLLRLPVPVRERAQEHSEALMREFALIASEARDDPSGDHVPARLLRLVESLNQAYAGFTGEQEAQLHAAAERGDAEIDLHYRVPPAAAGAAGELGRLLEEADEYCRAGRHLLTLATPEESVRLRDWFLGEFEGQAQGRHPVAWPDYRPDYRPDNRPD